ncbi:MAG: FemAB family PEP-CTERM system-associated protein [Desulfocapsaceae bacterium]|nr:FemAB family PEP-CTERM system-associated protein [Desulfosporosinus sp.]MDR3629528.1 FemAB family PEP-CTERM system-associated protein [Desulfocapsaceae bacterium]
MNNKKAHHIRLFSPSDEHRWNDYVDNHSAGTPFHRIPWKKTVEASFGHHSYYLLAEESDGSVVGVFPLFHLKSFLFGNYLTSIPFAELGGPLADSAGALQALVDYGIDITKNLKCDYLEIRSRNAIPGFKVKSLYYNFSREIFPEVEANLAAIPRKSRAAVRHGIKSGLTAEFGNHLLGQFYEVLAHSYHTLGTPVFSFGYFRRLLANHADSSQVMIIRTKEQTPVAAVMTFFYRDQVIPYYAGSLLEFRKLAPNDFMYWELMKYGCEQGYRIFDFGRSKEGTGSFDFKRHWGFEPKPLAYQYHLHGIADLPNLSPTNPKYRRKIQLWRGLPYFATKAIGPIFARYLA